MKKIGLKKTKLLSSYRKPSIRLLRKLAMTTMAVFVIWLLTNFLVETKDTQATWQATDFINQDFWASDPENINIITALYGDWETPGSSPYTRYRTGVDCNIQEDDIEYINQSNYGDLNSMQPNKIYLVESGNYIVDNQYTNQIIPANCSAIVWMWNVTFEKDDSIMAINMDWVSYVIIDNIKVDGAGNLKQWIKLINSNNNTINNVEVWDNIDTEAFWIQLDNSDYNTIHDARVHDNEDVGIKLYESSDNYISDSQVYNHNWTSDVGIEIEESNNNVINNCHVFNNCYWIKNNGSGWWGGCSSVAYNSINNTQVYNNTWWIMLSCAKSLLQQIAIYNNKFGIRWLFWGGGYINNADIYNNNSGLFVFWIITWYGEINLFDNWDNLFSGNFLPIWTTPPSGTSRSAGTINFYTGIMSKNWITNPINNNWDKLIDSYVDRQNNRWIVSWNSTEPTKYVIGKNILKQNKPIKYIKSNLFEVFGIQWKDYDTEKYIAEVQMQLSATDEVLVEYYYWNESEFTTNWNENNCSLGAFTVEHIDDTNFANKLLHNDPIGHTIYLIEEDNLWTDYRSIDIKDNCIAIVGENSSWTHLRWTYGSNMSGGVINIEGQENVILNNLSVNARKHDYGIYLSKTGGYSANNNTISNSEVFYANKDGIRLSSLSQHNHVRDTQTYINGEHGINILHAGKYNIVNNSLSYNNTWYGIYFGNLSKYNTINNGQFFNNWLGGLFTDFNTEQNIINNVHSYSNAGFGLKLKRSSWNVLNNMYIYNNNTWIHINDTSCVNNTYSNTLKLFDNNVDLYGTDWYDQYLNKTSFGSPLLREALDIQTWSQSLDCTRVTNPRWYNSYSSNPEEWGNESTWCNLTGNNMNFWPIWFNFNISDYLFGQNISKQKEPVWYNGTTIELLDTQYNDTKYIWEVNPIIWTNPGTINITSTSGYNNLNTNTIYDLQVSYNTGMTNHNYDIVLKNLHPSNATGYVAINMWWWLLNMGTWDTDIDWQDVEDVRLMITTSTGYYETVSGTLYIGTDDYGYATGNFELKTIPNPTPPTITWTNNIATGGLWYMSPNYWQANITWIYAQNTRAAYVTWASDCNSGIAVWSPNYTWLLVDITSGTFYTGNENQYVCIYTQDTTNLKTNTWLSNQIKISNLEFEDDVSTWPVYYDVIDINFQNLQNYGYRRVNTWAECNSGLSWSTLINYTTPIVLNSDTSFNDKYICAYGQDNTGSGKYVLSANDINISDYGDTVNFVDDVEDERVTWDTIDIYFSWAVTFDQKKYKRVNTMNECSNTGGMIDWTWDITITDNANNGKYFCLYSRELTWAVENYLISNNKLSIDTINPTTPTIESPIAGEDITFLIVETYGASDSESGITGFEYEIAENATFLDIVSDGIYYTSGTEIVPSFNQNINQTFAIRVRTVDAVGNKSARSSSVEFNYQELNNFEFENVEDAQAGEIYMSNAIIMDWLETNQTILANVTYGVLYRNGEVKWSSGLVQNNDELQIEMFASENYNDDIETELIIANRSIPWKITTNESGVNNLNCDLSNSQMLSIAAMFNSILNMYQGNQLTSFLITMQSMLEDNINLINDEDSICNMQYMLNLIENELNGTSNPTNTHIAPNCKEYNIDYSNSKEAHYSPDMVVRTYFGSRDELGKYLDSKNPGDCHINTYWNTVSYDNTDPNRHIAPNGKVYDIDFGQIGYTSPDFTYIKYFASLTELRNYIDKNNPAVLVWDHDVDPNFTPTIHTAPNGKTYKIYKTNRGYMSYKLLNVRYYSSLQELKNYIDKNNQ